MKDLRYASLEYNVYCKCVKVGMCRSNSKQDIHVKKVKDKKTI